MFGESEDEDLLESLEELAPLSHEDDGTDFISEGEEDEEDDYDEEEQGMEEEEEEGDEDDSGVIDSIKNPVRPSKVTEKSSTSLSVFGPGVDSLWEKKKRKGKGRSGKTAGKRLPPNIAEPFSQAQEHYIRGEYPEAIKLLSEVTRLAPKLPDPYHTMGLIYQESGNPCQALQFFVIAATCTPKSAELWKKIAYMAADIGEYQQALNAAQRVMKYGPDLKMSQFRVLMHIELRDINRAKESLKFILTKFPREISFLVEYANALQDAGYVSLAIQSYLRYAVCITGLNSIPQDVLTTFRVTNSFVIQRQKMVEDESQIDPVNTDPLFFAVRKVVDLLLDPQIGLDSAVSSTWSVAITNICFQFIQQVREKVSPSTSSNHIVPKVTLDIAILHGLGLLKSNNEADTTAGIKIIQSLLLTLKDGDVKSFGNKKDREVAGDGGDSKTGVEDIGEEQMQNRGAKGEGENDEKSDTTTELSQNLEMEMFMIRQRLRISSALGKLGRVTMGENALNATIAKLNALPLTDVHLAHFWCEIGMVYEIFNKHELALSYYLKSIEKEENNAESLYRFSSLCRTYKPSLKASAFSMLREHFVSIWRAFDQNQSATSKKSMLDDENEKMNSSTPSSLVPRKSVGTSQEASTDSSSTDPSLGAASESSHVYGTPGNVDKQFQQFTEKALENELMAILEWVNILLEEADIYSYCCATLPLLESWTSPNRFLHRPIMDKSIEMVSMKDLQTTASAIGFDPRDWLNDLQNSCWRFLRAVCDFIDIEKVLGKDRLKQIAMTTKNCMIKLGMANEAEEMMNACNIQCRTRIENVSDVDAESSHFESTSSKISKGGPSRSSRYLSVSENSSHDNMSAKRHSNVEADLVPPASGVKGVGHTHAKERTRDMSNKSIGLDKFIAAAADISNEVLNAAVELIQDSDSIPKANTLARLLLNIPQTKGPGTGAIEVVLPVQKLFNQYPQSLGATLLSAHEYASQRKCAESLDKYLDAFCMDPEQPLSALCLASYLAFLCQHRLVKRRQETLLKAFACLGQYRNTRLSKKFVPEAEQRRKLQASQFETLNPLSLEQEVLYNFGRFFQEIRLYHLAECHYWSVLQIAESHPEMKSKCLNLTREAAHNLVIILKMSDSHDLAYAIMKKHLTL